MSKGKKKVKSVKEPLSNVMVSVLSKSLKGIGIHLTDEQVDDIIDIAEEIQLNGGSVPKVSTPPNFGTDEKSKYGRPPMKERWSSLLKERGDSIIRDTDDCGWEIDDGTEDREMYQCDTEVMVKAILTIQRNTNGHNDTTVQLKAILERLEQQKHYGHPF